MRYIAGFFKSWRVEMVWLVMVFSLGMIVPVMADVICSEVPVFHYDPVLNECLQPASDCYYCLVWP